MYLAIFLCIGVNIFMVISNPNPSRLKILPGLTFYRIDDDNGPGLQVPDGNVWGDNSDYQGSGGYGGDPSGGIGPGAGGHGLATPITTINVYSTYPGGHPRLGTALSTEGNPLGKTAASGSVPENSYFNNIAENANTKKEKSNYYDNLLSPYQAAYSSPATSVESDVSYYKSRSSPSVVSSMKNNNYDFDSYPQYSNYIYNTDSFADNSFIHPEYEQVVKAAAVNQLAMDSTQAASYQLPYMIPQANMQKQMYQSSPKTIEEILQEAFMQSLNSEKAKNVY